MKNRSARLGAFIFVLTILQYPCWACDIDGKTGIFETNTLWIPPGEDDSESNVSQELFNTILDRIDSVYRPIIESMGKTFEIRRRWSSGTVNATAQQIGNNWIISMYGGLARHKETTPDAFAMIACHELGHHLGGFPRPVYGGRTYWYSNEGQSDYFASLKCFRKYAEKDNNIELMKGIEVPPTAIKKCQNNFKAPDDFALCTRSAMAGLSIGRLMRALSYSYGYTSPVKFDTPDPKVVVYTRHKHPQPQCRLDTYFAGSVCDQDHYTDVSSTDHRVGTCTRADNYTEGIRPLCWYKPPEPVSTEELPLPTEGKPDRA